MVRKWWKRCAAGCSAVVFAVLVVGAAGAATATFTSSDGPVTINDYSSGPTVASPSPSVINVGPGFGTVAKATVTLHGLTHTWPEDLNVLLVAPNGSTVVLMAQTGAGGAPSGDVTFDDAAALSYSDSAGGNSAGTWRPAQDPVSGAPGNCNWTGSLVSPAPAGPYGSTLASVAGGPGSGAWRLYVEDGCANDSGAMTSWSLTLTTTTSTQGVNRTGYCSVPGNTTPNGTAIPPGTFLDLAVSQPSTDSRYTGATPAYYYQDKGISCDVLPGYTKTGEMVGYGGHGDPGGYTYMAKN
jgi:subtilisin-like proprotein convertase family protein